MAGFEPKSTLASPGDCVIVVIDANRNKVMVDALAWAIRNIVQPKDTVVVLGLLSEVWKKNACIPLFSGTCKLLFLVHVNGDIYFSLYI